MSISTLSMPRSRGLILARLADYVELSKPRIALLVLVVVAVSYSLARWGQPEPWLLLHLLLGTLLVAASASSLNQWLERDRDALMPRTAGRPLPAGRLGTAETLLFAALTGGGGLAYLLRLAGPAPACWALLTWLVYVLLYTPLKSRTSLNTAIGAVSGATPVLIGWSAGAPLDLRAAALLVLVFLWQFPHFMAIATIYRQQYQRAGMAMLPVVDPSGRRAGVQAVFAALCLIPVSVIPALPAPGLGSWIYCVAVLVLGLGQLACALDFCLRQREASARNLLRASLVYLPALLFLLMLVPWL